MTEVYEMEYLMMHILLINQSPVVSRLLVLCTRDGHMTLEEVEDIDKALHTHYDVIFVDEDRYKNTIWQLKNKFTAHKKFFLSTRDDERSSAFDMIIRKPFLPSQITEILKNIKTAENKVNNKEETKPPSIFPLVSEEESQPTDKEESSLSTNYLTESDEKVSDTQILDTNEVKKIKSLLKLDEDDSKMKNEELSEEEVEKRKIEIIKEQLMADGLEIVEENEIIEGFAAQDENNIFISKKIKSQKQKKKKKKKKQPQFTQKELKRIEDAIRLSIIMLEKKKIKKLLKGKEIKMTVKLEEK